MVVITGEKQYELIYVAAFSPGRGIFEFNYLADQSPSKTAFSSHMSTAINQLLLCFHAGDTGETNSLSSHSEQRTQFFVVRSTNKYPFLRIVPEDEGRDFVFASADAVSKAVATFFLSPEHV
jgi:hypothetical protein